MTLYGMCSLKGGLTLAWFTNRYGAAIIVKHSSVKRFDTFFDRSNYTVWHQIKLSFLEIRRF